MKKQSQYSDKYGKVVAEGEAVEERKAPGVTFGGVEEPVVDEPVEVEEPKAVEEADEGDADEVEDDE